jgi:hypothetical protein
MRVPLLGVLLAASVFGTASAAAEALRGTDTLQGLGVARVLRDLSSTQLHFIYSSQLLPETLLVQREPRRDSPLALARDILAPHGLTVLPVSATLYAVANAPRAPAPATPSSAPPAAPSSGAARPAPAPAEALALPSETVIYGERHPFGLKSAEDALIYSATRLGAQPVLGEDALVSLARMPGISQGDLSGRLNIRGGGPEETLILLDGFPLRQPWHMPGYRGVLSLIDPGLLRQVAVYQGAIPARYGDRMSGVLDLQTLAPLEGPRHSLGAGFLNGRWRSDFELPGRAGDDDLLIAARYGATGYLIKALEPAAGNPKYGDVYTRLRVTGDGASELIFNALLSRDTLAMRRDSLAERSHLQSASAYFWLQGTLALSLPNDDAARLTTWLGHTHFEAQRDGRIDSPGFSRGELSEDREADVWDLRSQLAWSWNARHLLESGVEFYSGQADYRYASTVNHAPALAATLGVPASNTQSSLRDVRRHGGAAFITDTWTLAPSVTLQTGARLMFADAAGAESVERWDPRASLAWQWQPGTVVRAGWGRIHQVRDLTDIGLQQIFNGRPVPQRTEYRVLGVDHALGEGTLLRVEAFDKAQVQLLAQQSNLLRTPSLLPELSFDRFWVWPRSTLIRGVEATVQQSYERWRWSAAWAWSTRGETFVDSHFPRHWESRQNGSFTLETSLGRWLLSGAATYRGSLPTLRFATNTAGGLVLDRWTFGRAPGGVTVDLRAKWRRPLGDGHLSVIAQVSNLFDRSNCCAEFAPIVGDTAETPQLTLVRHGALPAIPWAGVSWDF